jgi:ADP-ribose diphosphatase
MTSAILSERVVFTCPWLDVVEKDVRLEPSARPETFYSVRTSDYAAAIALTTDGRIPLVRQYRPALGREMLELPSGAVDPGEQPEEAVRRELLEETGCRASTVVLLGSFATDSGRMETTQWAYFVGDAEVVGPPTAEEPLELLFVSPAELKDLVVSGEFGMAVHLGVLGAALVQGHLSL